MQKNTNALEAGSAAPIDDRKSWTTLQARAALAGHQLFRTADEDRYFCCKWGMVRSMGSIEEVIRFLDLVGAPK